MRHLFIVDPLPRLHPQKDSSIVLMREAAARGGDVHSCEVRSLSLCEGAVTALAVPLILRASDDWFSADAARRARLDGFDVVWMRKDPPFDLAYFHATLLLDLVRSSTLVVNSSQALRDGNEKLFALRFPDLCPPSLVSRSIDDILEFRERQGADIVIKPLDGCAGRGVVRIGPGDESARSILEISTANEEHFLLAQRYIPEVRNGDKRIMLVDGEPAGAVLRVPRSGELRANLHHGATPCKTDLTPREREICSIIGPELRKQGVIFAGIDVIGRYLTEVNITSPTGLREIAALDGKRIEIDILNTVENRLATSQNNLA